MHPKFGHYAEFHEPGVIDIDAIVSHPLLRDEFRLDAQHGPNGYRIVNAAQPDFALETAERADATLIVDLLNTARLQLLPDDVGAVTK